MCDLITADADLFFTIQEARASGFQSSRDRCQIAHAIIDDILDRGADFISVKDMEIFKKMKKKYPLN